MSLLHIDGFAHYHGSAGIQFSNLAAGAYSVIAANPNQATVSWPAGGIALQTFSYPGFGLMLVSPLAVSHSSGSLGVGYHLVYVQTFAAVYELISFLDASNNSLYSVRLDQSTGKLLIVDGSGTTIATSSGSLAAATIYHVEVKIILAGSSGGSIAVRVNGAAFVSVTGVTTNGTAVDGIGITRYISGTSTVCEVKIKDLFVWDNSGSLNNDWLGEQTVYTLYPSADTANADWTKSTGSNGYDLINDVPAVDTRYVEGGTVGDISIFDLTDLPTTALTIAGVRTVIRAEKTDPLGGTIDYGPKHGGTASLASAPQVNGQFLYYGKNDDVNPSTGIAWLSTEINAAQLELSRSA